MTQLPFAGNSIHLDEAERENIMRMAALNYSPEQMALYLDIDINSFINAANTPHTNIWSLIKQGIIVNKATPEIKLQSEAEKGNISAVQELIELNKQKSFDRIVQQLDEDEF